MDRVQTEKEYWNNAALDKDVDEKYICDFDVNDCKKALGEFDGRVLEIGCGVGRLMESGYYGIDISKNMLVLASERKPDCHFKLCDGRTIPFFEETFDFVYCILVIQHLKNDAVIGYINEASRVLVEGGSFRFQFIEGKESEPFSNHYLLSDIKTWLELAGLNVIKIDKHLVHGQWTWVTAVKV